MVLSDSNTNGIREPLTKRSCSNFNAIGVVSFGVTGGNAVYGLDGGQLLVERTVHSIALQFHLRGMP